MNILYLLSKNDSYDAVLEALDLTNRLANKGCKSIVASSLDRSAFDAPSLNIESCQLSNFESGIRNFVGAYKRLKEIIRERNIDIVHTYSPSGSWLAFWACRHTGKKMVTTCYEFYPQMIFNASLTLSDKVIVHNQALGEHLITNFNLSRAKLKFIRLSIDLESFNFQDVDQRSKTDFNVGIIAPSRPGGEYENFLKAMVKVVRIIPPVKIWIVSYRSPLKQGAREDLRVWIRRLGLTNYVKFFETAEPSLDFLSQLNLLMFSSFQENAGLRPILEAQACGVPVIATRVGGVTEIIKDRETGILVSPQDNSSLASAIINILKNFKFSRQIVAAARKRIEQEYDIAKNEKEFLAVYKQANKEINILAINTGNVQDVISCIPALRILKQRFPSARITSLVDSELRCLLRRCPYIDDFIVYDRKYKHRGFSGFLRILRLLSGGKFGLAFDFHNSFKTNLLAYLSLAGERYGYSSNFVSRFFVNKGVKRPAASLGVENDKLAILSLLGTESQDSKLELWPSEEDMEFANAFLRDNWVGKEKVVGMDISLKKRLFRSSRALEDLASLCDKLANHKIRVILVGSKDAQNKEKEFSRKIKSKPILATGDMSTIKLACLIKKCDLYISLNPETLYMALAMKTPSIILSVKRNGLNLSKYKNTETLLLKDFNTNKNIDNKRANLRGRHKDAIMETINRLMQIE